MPDKALVRYNHHITSVAGYVAKRETIGRYKLPTRCMVMLIQDSPCAVLSIQLQHSLRFVKAQLLPEVTPAESPHMERTQSKKCSPFQSEVPSPESRPENR